MTIQNRPLAVFSIAMLLVGVAVIISASRIPTGFSYDAVGPTVFPTIIGAGFVVSALLVILESVRATSPEDGQVPVDFRPVIVISAALLLEAFFIKKLGWVPMAAIVFAAGSWAFGDRRIVLNGAIGLVFSTLILVAFSWVLGLDLPIGVFETFFPNSK
ncbi:MULTISPECIES: tripartite tricarboxylate transporter TctB family protein [Ensifer]|jgi:putative tricarboxylic transport membrane protein|uniref:tripartite tricarboxylate transporter TctB family protein n=1 Tax=Ensifer TaxID=106591 RepID=UPI000712A49C|nr:MULTISPECIES: tripartite tricarboxylate transporter TctB family protein [Ensifer]KQX43220.1 hypothetical protein ASD49_11215 [Ensifer sp. Root1298]KQX72769.1 hypothetical protein ASD41_11715 [Ensifer sp. Root1312]KRC15735.1 hypothetical protein ASE29_11270 [Ensifer sp. Root74]KRD59010.1 hypothetical protein ASE71_09345 [Ensifer sp. Root954]